MLALIYIQGEVYGLDLGVKSNDPSWAKSCPATCH